MNAARKYKKRIDFIFEDLSAVEQSRVIEDYGKQVNTFFKEVHSDKKTNPQVGECEGEIVSYWMKNAFALFSWAAGKNGYYAPLILVLYQSKMFRDNSMDRYIAYSADYLATAEEPMAIKFKEDILSGAIDCTDDKVIPLLAQLEGELRIRLDELKKAEKAAPAAKEDDAEEDEESSEAPKLRMPSKKILTHLAAAAAGLLIGIAICSVAFAGRGGKDVKRSSDFGSGISTSQTGSGVEDTNAPSTASGSEKYDMYIVETGCNMRSEPGGKIVAVLDEDVKLYRVSEQADEDGMIWAEVRLTSDSLDGIEVADDDAKLDLDISYYVSDELISIYSSAEFN